MCSWSGDVNLGVEDGDVSLRGALAKRQIFERPMNFPIEHGGDPATFPIVTRAAQQVGQVQVLA